MPVLPMGSLHIMVFLFVCLYINKHMNTASQPILFNEDDLMLAEELFYCENDELKQEFSTLLQDIRLCIRKVQTPDPDCSLAFHPECVLVSVSGVTSTISLKCQLKQ